jgi:hypothetical protein
LSFIISLHDCFCISISCYAESVYLKPVKGKHCCKSRSFLSIIHSVYVFPPIALMQKVESSPNRSARLATHAQQQSLQHSPVFYFVPRSLFHCFLQLFQNLMLFL